MKKNIPIAFMIITYIFLMTYFYVDYSNSLSNYNEQSFESLNSLQNLIHKLHNEDSRLYKTLASYEIQSQATNTTNTIITQLLNLENSNQFSQNKLASTIDEYYTLQTIREDIVELNRLNSINYSTQRENQINTLIQRYEIQTITIINQVQEEIETNKKENLKTIDNLKQEFLLKELILLGIFLITTLPTLLKKRNKNKSTIETKEDKNIINYIKSEIESGNFPTIKEIKQHTKLSHPTLLQKLKELEKKGFIAIKKQGRNKHIFLR